jgi:hypothetical protein
MRFLLLSLLLVCLACEKEIRYLAAPVTEPTPAPTPEGNEGKNEEPKFFLQGDPAQLIYGTVLTNYIHISVLRDQELYIMDAFEMMQNKEIKTWAQTVTSATPDESRKEIIFQDDKSRYSFSEYIKRNGKQYYKFGRQQPRENNLFYVFEEVDTFGGLRLVGYSIDNKYRSLNQDYINISVSSDKSAITMLLYDNINTDSYRAIFEMQFSTKRDSPQLADTDKYIFWHGKNLISRWDQSKTLTVNICGKDLNDHYSLVAGAISQWQKALEGRLTIRLNRVLTGCLPFSDLNSHNIYMIDGLKTSYRNRNYGETRLIIYDSIVDSDIFMYKHELYKYSKDFLVSGYFDALTHGILHEFGHFLGLAHQFDPMKKTVMAYEQENYLELQPYDIEAIQVLYPLINPELFYPPWMPY